MITQCQSILNHLMSGRSITKIEAVKRFGITCSDKRISELRALGWPIVDLWEKTNGPRYKRYFLKGKRRGK